MWSSTEIGSAPWCAPWKSQRTLWCSVGSLEFHGCGNGGANESGSLNFHMSLPGLCMSASVTVGVFFTSWCRRGGVRSTCFGGILCIISATLLFWQSSSKVDVVGNIGARRRGGGDFCDLTGVLVLAQMFCNHSWCVVSRLLHRQQQQKETKKAQRAVLGWHSGEGDCVLKKFR